MAVQSGIDEAKIPANGGCRSCRRLTDPWWAEWVPRCSSQRGQEEWVVEDEAAYIEKAVSFATDLGGLAQLSASLRQRLESSPLMNAAELTQKLENAYRQMVKK